MKDQIVRDSVIEAVQERLPAMARLGMTADQIEASLFGTLNETEADLVWLLARHEISRAGRPSTTAPERLSLAG